METGAPGDRPCMKAAERCGDCDGIPNSCTINFCVDLGIQPDKEPSKEQLEKLYLVRVTKQSEWIRRQYGYTSKAQFIQESTEKILQQSRISELQKYLAEAIWQIAHLENVVQRMSEDYSDLTLLADQMGDALAAQRNLTINIAQTVLRDWYTFRDWFYEEEFDDDQEET